MVTLPLSSLATAHNLLQLLFGMIVDSWSISKRSDQIQNYQINPQFGNAVSSQVREDKPLALQKNKGSE